MASKESISFFVSDIGHKKLSSFHKVQMFYFQCYKIHADFISIFTRTLAIVEKIDN